MSDDERAEVRLEAAGRDVDVARATLPRFYDGSSWTTSPTQGDYAYRYAAIGDATMTLRSSRMQGYIEGDIPPGDDYVVQWITQGDATVDVGRDELRMERDRPLLFPSHRPFVFAFSDYDQKLVHLNRDLVHQVASERLPADAGPLRFDHHQRADAGAVRLWHDTVTLVSRTMRGGTMSPLLWNELSRMTTVAFLELYAPAVEKLPPALLSPAQARLRRAVEHIHERAHLPLTPTDIAEAADLSVRGLQEAFQRGLGVTPLGYLRQVRLDRVHAELAEIDPELTSVADVAKRWGFAHLGRFSAAYVERFGEYPSRTLRR